MEIRELTSLEQMMAEIDVIRHLYPKITKDRYQSLLNDMLAHNYTQIAAYDNGTCVGLSGCWSGTKLWCGKFIELDNFVVVPDYRSKGVGKMICDFIQEKAIASGCTNLVLDAYTTNFAAHRFYYNQGYGPKGFHFVKILDPDGLT